MVKLVFPADKETVCVKTNLQKAFYDAIRQGDMPENWRSIIKWDEKPKTTPLPVHFEWFNDHAENEFVLAEDPEFETVLYRAVNCDQIDIYNLKVGKTYYWRVADSEVYSFRVDDMLPRWIRADGAYNIRDIGGYVTQNGKRVKQGLLFRGTQIDFLTEEGRKVLRDDLGIHYDLDFRSLDEVSEVASDTTVSPLGKDIIYERIPIDGDSAFFEGTETCASLFRLLLNPENYPLYYHCERGADRTGALSVVIEGVLGVSDLDIVTDYQLTSLSKHIREKSAYRFLEQYPPVDGTISEKIVVYLKERCGITDEEINCFRNLMLEDYVV